MTEKRTYLGIELGSTRIKAVTVDGEFGTVESGSHTWQSRLEDGIWTYSMEDVQKGLTDAVSQLKDTDVRAMGVSGMMHGYLAFDKDWDLLVPFRTWQNTMTGPAAEALTSLFGFNIPQRWSIAHLYQAILNGEEHVKDIAHITTLAGHVHHTLTGENVVGIGEASGIFPVNSETLDYDQEMVDKFDYLIQEKGFSWKLRDVLPEIRMAGQPAGALTEEGAAYLGDALKAGIPFCPPEGDAGTGMVATNAVAPRTGNVSAGTSVFSMVVLERPLRMVYPEIDLVTTPTGKAVAMVHCNNCTGDTNAWAGVLRETAELFGGDADDSQLYTKLYEKSLEGEADCGGLLVYNYLTGEGVTHLNEGRPMVIRTAGSRFTLANFMRAQLYSTLATLKIGMDILASENVAIDSLTGHGGLFKTPLVGQKYLAAACDAPVTCMETAGEGGPYGMALLAAYMDDESESLEEFLKYHVFRITKSTTVSPDREDIEGFNAYIERFRAGLASETAAIENIH